jgi:hypothetical protein
MISARHSASGRNVKTAIRLPNHSLLHPPHQHPFAFPALTSADGIDISTNITHSKRVDITVVGVGAMADTHTPDRGM